MVGYLKQIQHWQRVKFTRLSFKAYFVQDLRPIKSESQVALGKLCIRKPVSLFSSPGDSTELSTSMSPT